MKVKKRNTWIFAFTLIELVIVLVIIIGKYFNCKDMLKKSMPQGCHNTFYSQNHIKMYQIHIFYLKTYGFTA